ncbi:MAG: hypothetical protein ACK5N8_02840 [Alphaproteobacteria bacterium]
MKKLELHVNSFDVDNNLQTAFYEDLYVGLKSVYSGKVSFSEVYAGNRLVGFSLSSDQSFDSAITPRSLFNKENVGYIPIEAALIMFSWDVLRDFVFLDNSKKRRVFVKGKQFKEVSLIDKHKNQIGFALYRRRCFVVWEMCATYVR